MWFAGEGGECRGYLLDACADVGRGGARVAAAVSVAGVSAGDGVAEVAFDPGQRGVAQPVGTDLLDGHTGQVLTDALPQMVVAAIGQRLADAVAQQLPARW